ncbi:MAG: hypothetical protein ACI84C_001462 [Flavobacteriales bacterium]|jgi:uncharacterized protein YbaP (TraB family)
MASINMKLLLSTLIIGMSVQASAQGLLYKVYGEGIKDTSYVYGTYHTKDSQAYFMKDKIKELINQCELVAGEVDIEDAKSKASEIAPIMMLPKGELGDLYSAEDFERVTAYLKDKLGMKFILCNRLKPFFVLAMLTEKLIEGDEKMVLDEWIQKQAKKAKKEIVGLETIQEALAGIDSVSVDEQAKWLLDFIDGGDEQTSAFEDLNHWYLKQEIDSMYEYYLNEEIPGEFDSEFLVRRNIYFTDRVFEHMKTQTVFCGVGALHLPGKTGLLLGLRAKGVNVEVVNAD